MSGLVLNDLIVRQAPLLRAVQSAALAPPAELARILGRDPSNTRRDLAAMERAGHVRPDMDGALRLSAEAQAQLAAIDRIEAGETGGEPGLSGSADPLSLSLLHAQITPDPDNARRDWDSDEARMDLFHLRMDIVEHGLHQNLLVRPLTAEEAEAATLSEAQDKALAEGLTLYRLVAGERRWRAIGQAMEESDWPEDRPIHCRLLETDDVSLRIAALSENLQRRDLNPIEKAHGFEGLAAAGLSNQEIADRFNKTPEHVQQHRSFLRLSEADQVRMTLTRDDRRRLSVRDARDKVAEMNRVERREEMLAPLVEAAPDPGLTPVERLIAAELLHAVHRHAAYTYGDIEVGPGALEDPALSTLVEAGYLRPPAVQTSGALVGRIALALAHNFPFLAFPTLRSGTRDDFDRGLDGERDRFADFIGETVAVEADHRYVTDWLNGPFEVTPDGQVFLDAAQADEQAREARQAHEGEERARIAQAHAAAIARTRDLFTQGRVATVAGRVDGVQEIVSQAEAPLPWRMSSEGNVVAADGAVLIHNAGKSVSEARLRLMVLSVNAAARLETPEDEADA